MTKNIVLTGFMGTGKTVTARVLAAARKAPLFSTDTLVEEKAGKPISEIFAKDGQKAFRRLESEVVAGLAAREGAVIDCGGGIVLNPDNVTALKKNGVLFLLTATPELIWERIGRQKDRPLLDVKDPLNEIRRLLKEREGYYRQTDYIIDTNGLSGESTSEAILKILDEKKL